MKYHLFNSPVDHSFDPEDVVIDRITHRTGIGVGNNRSITSRLHLGPGIDKPGYGMLKFTEGSLLSSVEEGAIEYSGDRLYFTPLATREKFAFFSDLLTSNIIIPTLGTPTVDRLNEYIDSIGSSGWFDGGEITDSGGGQIDIAAGAGAIRATNNALAPILSFEWGQFLNIPIPTDTARYVYIDYNSGSPTYSLSTDEFLEAPNKLLIGIVINTGGTIHSAFNLGVRLAESIGNAGRFLRRVLSLSRDIRKGGLILGETGTRNITFSEGSLWWGKTEYPIAALDTSVSGSFETYHRDGSGGFTLTSSVTQWPNTQYDNNSGVLATMTNNHYAVLWFYIEPDDDLVMVYGRDQYTTSAAAELESAPSTLPLRLSEASLLVARLIFQKSAATATLISSAFATTFSSLGVTAHGDLTGLTLDHHTQYLLVDGTRAMTGGLQGVGIASSGNIDFSSLAAGGIVKAIITSGRLAIASSGTDYDTAHNLLSSRHSDTLTGSPVLGDLLYGDSTPNWTKLGGNITTTKKVLSQIGTGLISAVPSWDTLVDGDIPDILTVTKIGNLTSNGFVKTSGGDGTLSVDTSTYLTAESDTLALVMGRGATTGIQLVSTLAIGTSPFAVTSTTLNTNLNADLLDGSHASAFQSAGTYVTSVGATSPINSSGGTTPTISVNDVATGSKGVAPATGTPITNVFLRGAITTGAVSWEQVSYTDLSSVPSTFTPSAHNLLSASHGDTTTGTVSRGDLVVGQGVSPKWERLVIGTSGKYLRTDGTDASWATVIDGDLPSTIVRTSRTINTTSPLAGGGDLSSDRTFSLAGLSSLGTGNYVIGVNAGATAWEYKSLATGTTGTDFAIAHSVAGVTFDLPIASSSNTGKLSSTDWTTFNSKQAAGSYITALTGEVTAAGPGSVAATITEQTSSFWLGKVSDETGTGVWVFNTAPTFITNIWSPIVIGGTGTTSTLALRSTSGVGAAGADIIFQTGNNGATEGLRVLNSGNVYTLNSLGIGAAPSAGFDVDLRKATSGGDVQLLAFNSSNTASSTSTIQIATGGATAADPTLFFNVNGVGGVRMGIDNSDSDKFKIQLSSSALGTTAAALTLSSNGLSVFNESPTTNARIDVGSIAPGTAVPYYFLLGYGANSGWPVSIGGIYDGSHVSTYITFNGLLTGGTKAAPTFTGGTNGGTYIMRDGDIEPAFEVGTYATGAGATPVPRLTLNQGGSWILGSQAALATNATGGFVYIPTSAGVPTGVPTAVTGKTAMEYDTTNNRLYIYNGGWKYAAFS